jgi:hypothetical protein
MGIRSSEPDCRAYSLEEAQAHDPNVTVWNYQGYVFLGGQPTTLHFFTKLTAR